jgi:hypothetical protein
MAIGDPGIARSTAGLKCPTCGAQQAWTDSCRRCKSDLRLLREALAAYEQHRRSTLRELDAGRLESALRHARRCQELRPGPESQRLLAVCQLLRGDWLEAIDRARAAAEDGTESER